MQDSRLRCRERHTARLPSGRTDPSAPRPTAPLPRCPAVRRPTPTRPWYIRVLDSTNKFYKKQSVIGSTVSSRERGAVVPLVIQTGRCVARFGLKYIFFVRDRERRPGWLFTLPWGAKLLAGSWAHWTAAVLSRLAPPRPTLPRPRPSLRHCAPPCPARSMSGF